MKSCETQKRLEERWVVIEMKVVQKMFGKDFEIILYEKNIFVRFHL